MKTKYDYLFGVGLAVAMITAGLTMAIPHLLNFINMFDYYYGFPLVIANKVLIITIYMIMAAYALGYAIFILIKRNNELAYRGALISIASYSIGGALLEAFDFFIDVSQETATSFAPLVNAILVLITGGFFVFAGLTKQAERGRRMAISMCSILILLTLVYLILDVASGYRGPATYYIHEISTVIAYGFMVAIAWRRKTFVLYY